MRNVCKRDGITRNKNIGRYSRKKVNKESLEYLQHTMTFNPSMIQSTESSFIRGTRAWIQNEIKEHTTAEIQLGITLTFLESPYMKINRQKSLLIKYIIPRLRKIGFRSRLVAVPHESYLDLTIKQTRPDLTKSQKEDSDTDTDENEASSDEEEELEKPTVQRQCEGCTWCAQTGHH